MKFRINAEELSKAVKPAVDIALKNTIKDFDFEGVITLEAHPSTLHIKAYGGTASIIVKVPKKLGYVFEERGAIAVDALELRDSLKSFGPSDDLIVSAEGSKLRLSQQSAHQVFHELSATCKPIRCPRTGRSFAEKIQVDRHIFVNGLKKIAYAMAREEKMFTYMCTLFESWKNKVRFTAGSGGRFALAEIEGDGKSIASGETQMIFPKANIPNIMRILKNESSDNIKIKSVESNPDKKVQEQIVITSGNVILALYGLENFTKYPDVNSIISHDYSYKFSTSVEDWKYVTEAISATYHAHNELVHNTRIEADISNGWINVTPRTAMTVNRRIPFEPGTCTVNPSKKKSHKPWFKCNSSYLLEMVKKGYKDGNVSVKFECQSKLDNIPANKPRQMKPILMEYPERTNKDGTREKYTIFFTVSTK